MDALVKGERILELGPDGSFRNRPALGGARQVDLTVNS